MSLWATFVKTELVSLKNDLRILPFLCTLGNMALQLALPMLTLRMQTLSLLALFLDDLLKTCIVTTRTECDLHHTLSRVYNSNTSSTR